jgi:hypothetical protein
MASGGTFLIILAKSAGRNYILVEHCKSDGCGFVGSYNFSE